jgi:phosphate transport system permease protein
MILGLGRALGEAIAVAMVMGGVNNVIGANLFNGGNTLAGQIVLEFPNANPGLETSSLFTLALILLVFSLVVNGLGQVIVRRSMRRQGVVAP